MIPTPIGVFTLLAVIIVFRGPPVRLLNLTIVLMILGAAAAVVMPSLGGASVPPTRVALGFLLVRLFIDPKISGRIQSVVGANMPMVGFALYAAVGAFLLPRLFAGLLSVVAQRPTMIHGLIVAEPLRPSSANFTQLFYVLSTALALLAAQLVATTENIAERLSRVMVGLGLLHVAFGVIDQLAFYAHLGNLLEPLRNATYSEVGPQLFASGVKRISGSFPEPSSYATFGFPIAVFLVEWWLRRPRAPWAGVTAALVVFMMLLCTASTGYLSLAGYALLLVLRGFRGTARGFRFRKVVVLIGSGLAAALAGLVFAAMQPQLVEVWTDLIDAMTFGKASSSSGAERLLWAQQGWSAFQVSLGLGVGVGSFRSSSLFTSVLGSVGVPGSLFLAMQVILIAWPRRQSGDAEENHTLIAASQWTALMSLLPLAVSGATPDPGLMFGIFGGIAASAPRRPLLRRGGGARVWRPSGALQHP